MKTTPRPRDGLSRFAIAWATLLACSTWLGCTRAPSQPDAGVAGPQTIAMVNGKAISVEDVTGRVGEFSTGARKAYAGSPDLLKQQAEKLIEEELIISVAKKRGYDRDPRIQHMLRNQLVQMVREDVRKLVKLSEITDAEIKAYYDQNPDKFSKPLRLRARHILLSDKAAAQNLLNRLRAQGGSEKAFIRAARRESLDAQTRERGGDLGFATRPGGAVQPQLFLTMQKLSKPGELGGPVRSRLGWHLLLLTERRESERQPLERVKLAAKMGAFRAKRKRLYAKFIQEQHATAEVTRFYNRIDKVQAALGDPTQAPQAPPQK